MLSLQALAPSDLDSDLDALLAESLQIKNELALQKKKPQRIPKQMVSPEVKRAIDAKVLEWENRREWAPEAAVAFFDAQRCTFCNSLTSVFKGILQRQSHRQTKVDRWVRVDAGMNNLLPKETKVMQELTDICSQCAVAHGFDFPIL